MTAERVQQALQRYHTLGDSAPFAEHLCRLLARGGFDSFLRVLSAIARGTLDEKLAVAFSLYDADGDGAVSRSDMCRVLSAVHALAGGVPDAEAYVAAFFQRAGAAQSMSTGEFYVAARTDPAVVHALVLCDGAL